LRGSLEEYLAKSYEEFLGYAAAIYKSQYLNALPKEVVSGKRPTRAAINRMAKLAQ